MYTIQRVNCNKHPSEQLNNFCSNPKCKIALCASCIGQHTYNHLKQGTNPVYSNIKDVVLELNKQLQRYLEDTRQTLKRIVQFFQPQTDIMERIQNKELALRQLMKSIRNEATQLLNNQLSILQQHLMNQINTQTQKSYIHSFSKMQSLAQKVKKEKNIYLQCLQQIKKPEIAHNIKVISEDVLYDSVQSMSTIKQQVEKNQQIQSGFIYNQDKLKEYIIKGIQGAVVYFTNDPSKPQTQTKIQKTEIEKKKDQSKLLINTNINFSKLTSPPPEYTTPNNRYQNFTCHSKGNSMIAESLSFNPNHSSARISMSPNASRAYMTSVNFYTQANNQKQSNKFAKQSFNKSLSGTRSTKGNFRPFGNRNQ